MALEVSVVFVVVEAEGWLVTPAFGLPSPKWPWFLRDSPASESDVTVPTASLMGIFDWGSVVTYRLKSAILFQEILCFKKKASRANQVFGGMKRILSVRLKS